MIERAKKVITYQKCLQIIGKYIKKWHLDKYFSKEVKGDIEELAIPVQFQKKVYEYYEEKILLCFGIFFCSLLILGLILIDETKNKTIWQDEHGKYIVREGVDGGTQKVPITIDVNGEKQDAILEVSELKYSEAAFEKRCDEIVMAIPDLIKGDNDSLEQVRSDLLLNIPNISPLSYEWRMDDYTYISSDGKVSFSKEAPEQSMVMLTLALSYGEYFYEHTFPIMLVKKQKQNLSSGERIKEFLQNDERQKKQSINYYLPTYFEKTSVEITEQSKHTVPKVLLCGCLISLLIYFLKNKDLHKEVEKRREELQKEYPEFVSKLMLYMGAGMTTKGALLLLGEDYKNKTGKTRNYLYEELNYLKHSLENSMFEQDAYEQFGKRTRLNTYRKLMSILSQNSKKGTDNLLNILDEEAKESFVIRKNQARRLGEKAGTKLLLPMILMLGIVMIIIIVPAFLSYDI